MSSFSMVSSPRCHLGQNLDRTQSVAEGAFALHDSSVNGMDWEAWLKERVALAESAAVEAEAKARAAEAEADAKAKAAVKRIEVAKAEAEAKVKSEVAKARAAEAEAAIKIRVAEAVMREADLKIVKFRKELEVLTGESEVKEYLLFLSLRPSLCLSLTACFSDLNSLGSLYSVFASVFFFLSFLQACRWTAEMRSRIVGPCS